uniref:NADP-dependent oxidoreductase domain-containing protein n=1 Tax=Ananas comosus var. bracteatus TaxID=296719 RepID=A0A6V7NMI2_ANACO|nr:unnamed protein product [Ananas comosus var. bracteatus]
MRVTLPLPPQQHLHRPHLRPLPFLTITLLLLLCSSSPASASPAEAAGLPELCASLGLRARDWPRQSVESKICYLIETQNMVSKLGFGCMGLSGFYNSPVDDEAGLAVIKRAFESGITFFDTSDVYGPRTNEILVGKALKQLPREKVQLATKFGVVGFDLTKQTQQINGRPEYVRACCEASLERLGVEYIDLYYQHRVDQTVPIEETMGELKKLVEEGKVKYIGLSEASPDTIRRAHAVHPISALQMEWSLWTREIESDIVPLCRELGIGIVSYSPLGRGFFAGKGLTEELPQNSFLQSHPRFSGGNLEKNKPLYVRLENLAMKHQCTPAQLALAWVLHQGDDVVPIPGTTKIRNLDSNIGSLKVKLTKEDMKEICDAVCEEDVVGHLSSPKPSLGLACAQDDPHGARHHRVRRVRLGALALEAACGRRPIEPKAAPEELILVE